MEISIVESMTGATAVIKDGEKTGAIMIAASMLQIPLRNAIVEGTEHNGLRIQKVSL